MVDEKTAVDPSAVQAAIHGSRRDYEVLLSKNQIATLKKVHRAKQVDNDEEYNCCTT